MTIDTEFMAPNIVTQKSQRKHDRVGVEMFGRRLRLNCERKGDLAMTHLSVKTSIHASFIFLAAMLVLFGSAPAVRGVSLQCHEAAIGELKRLSPDGYAVYADYNNKADFKQWISDCSDMVGGLATAVHETIHMVTDQKDAFPLINGGRAYRIPEWPAFYRPSELLGQFSASSPYVQNYLKPGEASSADFFRYLMDEFNAYSHDLNTAIRLKPLEAPDQVTHHRDGLAAFMAFVAAYAAKAKADHPQTWKALKVSKVRASVYTLWSQAEDVMGNSCRIRNIANEATQYLRQVCTASILHPLSELLGRPPLCPVRCLR